MESFIKTLTDAQQEDVDQSEITDALLSIQNHVNLKFLSPLESKDVEKIFTEIWKFLLYTANSNQSSIRLTAYRATGLFLLKTTPYYPRQIQRTFSDIAMQSTIDIKSSAILASSFAFIANMVPLHQLEKFLDTTPVFHHFTISDPIFSEHLALIIAKLKRLGLEWMQTLLHSFLEMISTKSDRFLFKSLAAIITHFPKQLIKEVVEFICTQEDPTKHIPLLSFIFSSVQNLNPNDVDLTDVAFIVMDILQNTEKHIPSEIDSSFQIYSLKTDSFSVKYELQGENELKIICTTKKGEKEAILDITKFKNNPSFYSMRLPMELLKPTSENGSLIITAKINTLGLIATENQEEYISILMQNIGERYDDKIAACCTSIATCINNLKPSQQLANLFSKLVFTKQTSWFHSLNIMKLLHEVKADTVEKLLGQSAVDKIISILIDMSFNVNEKVYTESPQVLSDFIRPKDINNAILEVARNIDVYDEDKFMRSISLLTFLIKNHEEADMNYLQYLINIIIEAFPLYKGTVASIAAMFNFLALFDLSFLDLDTAKKLAKRAHNISNATLEMMTGMKLDSTNLKVKQYLELIDEDLSSRNFDIISGNSLDHEQFLSGLLSAVRLLIVMPIESLDIQTAVQLSNAILKVLPYESAKLFNKIWGKMPEKEQIVILEQLASPLAFIKDFGAISIWANLLLTNYSQAAKRLSASRDILHKLSYYALCYPDIVPDAGILVFTKFETIVVLDINTIIPVIEKFPEDRKNKMLKDLFLKYPDCYKKLRGDKPPPEVAEEEKVEIEKPKINISYEPCPSTDFTNDLESPFIITQLRSNVFEFSQETISLLLQHYCITCNKAGLRALFYYSRIHKFVLDFTDVLVPENLIVLVMQYLKSVKAESYKDFARKALLKYGGRDIAIAAAACIPESFIHDLTEERITKKAITYISMAIQKIPLNQQAVLKFVIDSMTPANEMDEIPPKRFATAVCLANLTCALIPNIPADWAEKVIDLIKAREDTPVLCKARFIATASSKTPKTSQRLSYVKGNLLLDCVSKTSEMFYVYQALWYMEPKSKIMDKLHEVAQQYLNMSLPSVFSCGTRLLNMSFTRSATDQQAEIVLKTSLQLALNKFVPFSNLPTIPEYFVLLLTNIMNRSTLLNHHRTILKAFDSIIPQQSSASFPAMSICLPKMVAIAEPTNEVLKKITSYSMSLITTPGSLFLLKVQLSITREEAQRNKGSAVGSDTLVLDRATEFLAKAKEIDGASMTDIIYEYIMFIVKSLGLNDGLQFVVLQFHKYIGRFFTLFAALCKFLKRTKLLEQPRDEQEKQNQECVEAMLEMFSSLLSVKCHAKAIECLRKKQNLKEAVQLASFNEDCDASNEIIAKINNV